MKGLRVNLSKTKLMVGGEDVIQTSCRRAAATICPHPGLQWKRTVAALS